MISVSKTRIREYGQDWTRFYKPDPSAVSFRNAHQVRDLVELARKDHLGLYHLEGELACLAARHR